MHPISGWLVQSTWWLVLRTSGWSKAHTSIFWSVWKIPSLLPYIELYNIAGVFSGLLIHPLIPTMYHKAAERYHCPNTEFQSWLTVNFFLSGWFKAFYCTVFY